MTLRNGRELLAMPGPTNVPDAVLSAMHRPAIDIYAGSLLEITATCLEDLRRLFRTEGPAFIYAANGHGAGPRNVSCRRRSRAGARDVLGAKRREGRHALDATDR